MYKILLVLCITIFFIISLFLVREVVVDKKKNKETFNIKVAIVLIYVIIFITLTEVF